MQSGDADILKKMNRHMYIKDYFLRNFSLSINYIKSGLPNKGIIPGVLIFDSNIFLLIKKANPTIIEPIRHDPGNEYE